MNNEKSLIIELINKEIDGANSHEDSIKLKEFLGRDREAQDLYNDLMRISTQLKMVKEVEPPRNLRANIINSIDFNRYSLRERRSPLGWVRDVVPRRVPLRYALIFSMGLFAGIVIYTVFSDGNRDTSVDISKLYGTMLVDRSSEKLETVDNVEITLDKVTGTIRTMQVKGLVLVDVSLRSEQEIETVFDFDSGFLSFIGYRQVSDSRNSLNIGENSLRLTNVGEKRYLLLFNDKAQIATFLNVKILASGAVLYEKPLSAGRKSD